MMNTSMHRMDGVFRLALMFALPVFAQKPFAWKDVGGGRVELSERGKPALAYNYGPQLKPGAPEASRRCCYIFPLYTPSGVSLLDDFPPGDLHHRGLYWAWPVVEAAGKQYDLWMAMTVRQRSPGAPLTRATASEARMEARSVWVVDGKAIVRESLRLRVTPAKDAAREMEVELTWRTLGAPVTLRGSREPNKSYGGFNATLAPRQGTVLRSDGETLSKDEDLTPRGWAELEGVYGGRKAVLRITPDPKDTGTPYQWCLRQYGFLGASFPGKTASADGYTLEPGKPLTLKFRVRVSDLQ
jgi:hypothetical protein